MLTAKMRTFTARYSAISPFNRIVRYQEFYPSDEGWQLGIGQST